ncbi:MAG: hypothetical protein AB1806_14755 [Acidobacteriota bacterium]
MNDELDRVLAAEPDVVPSSRFAGNVIAAVRREAAMPPPIEFPWRRALPAIIAAGIVLLALVGLAAFLAISADYSRLPTLAGVNHAWLRPLVTTAAACLLSWFSVRASAILSARR